MTRQEHRQILTLKLSTSELKTLNEKMRERVKSWQGKKPCSKELLSEFELGIRQFIISERKAKAEEKSRIAKQEREEYSLRCQKEFSSGIHAFWDMDVAPLCYVEELKSFQSKILLEEKKSWWKLFHAYQKKMNVEELVSDYIQVLKEFEKFVDFCNEIRFQFGQWNETSMGEYYVPAERLLKLYQKNINEIVNS